MYFYIWLEFTPVAKIFLFRGIDTVRNKIKMFAQKKVTLPKGRHKIIILDEADRFFNLFILFQKFYYTVNSKGFFIWNPVFLFNVYFYVRLISVRFGFL